MRYNMASWKLLEEMMIELRKTGFDAPANILEDLRSAKSLIQVQSITSGEGEATQKTEELASNIEAYLVTEALRVFGSEKVDLWLRNLEEAKTETCEKPAEQEKFVAGLPRDQKWVRVEPIVSLPKERILAMAKENSLQVTPQKDGRLVVYGQPQNLKDFIKKMTSETAKK